jgi:putative DNA primase/helicase
VTTVDLDQAIAKAGRRRRFNMTDLGNAERIVDGHGTDLRFVPNVGWHVWDERRWRIDGDGEVHRRAKQTVRRIALDALDEPHTKKAEAQLKFAMKSEARPRLEAMVALAETDADVVASIDDLDADPYALNVQNGTVDLLTGELRDHDQADHITKLAPVFYDPAAKCPTWDGFLETSFDGEHELIRFLQRGIGYSLTGSTTAQVMFILHGRGANGKSTFLETVRSMLGDYAQQAPADLLMQARANRGGATPDLARLPGARFVSAVETGEGRKLDEPLVKQITGGDRIAARRLYRDVFEFTPTHKLWLATNHLPEVRGTDEAIWRRIRLVPFTVTIPEAKRDKGLAAKLRLELPGILAWAIRGCTDYLADGLEEPDAVKAATQSYRDDMDELGAFLEERVQIEETLDAARLTVKASVLFTMYEYWCRGSGISPMSSTAFGRQLSERGLRREKRRDGWHYLGVRLEGQQEELN